tara:strand:+ start:4839 stop:5096 length:258 start_codon:yes stop_codon:yes gene_type:complete
MIDKYIRTTLIIIAIGIWALVLQNLGIVPSKQVVYVKGGYIDVSGSVEVENKVDIQGSVEVENTVSISIDEVLGENGKKYYFKNY